jgi:hypothetical protein
LSVGEGGFPEMGAKADVIVELIGPVERGKGLDVHDGRIRANIFGKQGGRE